MPIPRDRLRLRPQDLADLLDESRTAHVATVGADGRPHVVPLWFVWHDGHLWVNSLRRSRRGADLAAGSAVSVCIDAGVEYGELRGVTFSGSFRQIADEATLEPVRKRFAEKYWHGIDVPSLSSHVWLQLVADREASWDFRRIGEVGRDRRLEALRDDPD